MTARTLVVSSNASCLPEIAGPAADLVDPLDTAAIAAGIAAALRLPEADRARRLDAAAAWAANSPGKRRPLRIGRFTGNWPLPRPSSAPRKPR